MAKKKKHSRVEIASRLAQANDLATQGKLQSEIARTLGVSAMTLHRWRKASPGPRPALVAAHEAGQPYQMRRGGDQIAELQFENSRLRRLVTDLLLEKIKLEEAGPTFGQVNGSRNASRRSWHNALESIKVTTSPADVPAGAHSPDPAQAPPESVGARARQRKRRPFSEKRIGDS